jgi:inosose dehydratase
VVRALEDAGYAGWYVLEQDTSLTADGDDAKRPLHDTAQGLAHLAEVTARPTPGTKP